MVGSGGLVVGGAALQLLSAGAGLRVLQAPAVQANGKYLLLNVYRDFLDSCCCVYT